MDNEICPYLVKGHGIVYMYTVISLSKTACRTTAPDNVYGGLESKHQVTPSPLFVPF